MLGWGGAGGIRDYRQRDDSCKTETQKNVCKGNKQCLREASTCVRLAHVCSKHEHTSAKAGGAHQEKVATLAGRERICAH